MNKGPSVILAKTRAQYDHSHPKATDDEATVPWTFNQILLPLILVLTFIILTQLSFYVSQYVHFKNEAEKSAKKANEWEGKAKEEKQKAQDWKDKADRYRGEVGKLTKNIRTSTLDSDLDGLVTPINLQLFRLKEALEKEKLRRLLKYEAARFVERSDAGRVLRHGLELRDDEFQTFCRITSTLRNSREGRPDETANAAQIEDQSEVSTLSGDELWDQSFQWHAQAIYRAVLQTADIKDPLLSGDASVDLPVVRTKTVDPIVQKLSKEEFMKMPDDEWKDDVLGHDSARITARNRRIVHNLILDFLDSLLQQAVRVQEGLVAILRSEAVDGLDPGDLPSNVRRHLKLTLDEQRSLEDRADSNQLFFKSLYEMWNKEYENAGYPMVFWETLSSL